LVVGCAIFAIGCFVAATQGWLLTRNRWYETVLLLLICFTLFRPGYWLDRLQAPFDESPPALLFQVAETVPQGGTLRFRLSGQSRAGEDVDKLLRLTMRSGETGAERLRAAGLTLNIAGGTLTVQTVRFGSEAAKYGVAPGDEITAVLVPSDRPNRYWFAVPALLLLAVIIVLQRRRTTPRLDIPSAGRIGEASTESGLPQPSHPPA
jgi:Domain of unknown function (DUF3394)